MTPCTALATLALRVTQAESKPPEKVAPKAASKPHPKPTGARPPAEEEPRWLARDAPFSDIAGARRPSKPEIDEFNREVDA